jgi:hypothetical protein
VRIPSFRRLLSLSAGAIALLALAPCASALAQTVTFLPGSSQEFKVPVGVSSVQIGAVGGEGETAAVCRSQEGAGVGGPGAQVTAVVPVDSSSTLYVQFPAGGAGGIGAGEAPYCSLDAGSGGGASEVLASPSEPLVVAGGGGGGGASMGQEEPYEEETEAGGAGGGAASSVGDGSAGELHYGSSAEVEGAGGGGGESGKGGAAGAFESAMASWATAAAPGTLAYGGAGGTWNGAGGTPFTSAGGGGGSGYYGGGGGGVGNTAGGGGGAGSSFLDTNDGVTGTIVSGAGEAQEVTITYTVAAAPTATITAPARGGVYTQGAVVETGFSCAEGEGGSGIESCMDSNGASAGTGVLDTATLGTHTYAVTATSKDGLSAGSEISYTVEAPPVSTTPASTPTASTPAVTATATPQVVSPSITPPPACVSRRSLLIHVAEHVSLPPGVKIKHAEVLLGTRVLAQLSGADPVATVDLAGLPKGAYTVTLVVRSSRGKTARSTIVLHTCEAGAAT